jgi:hypothetical protein
VLTYELPDGRLKLIDCHLRREFDGNMEVEVEIRRRPIFLKRQPPLPRSRWGTASRPVATTKEKPLRTLQSSNPSGMMLHTLPPFTKETQLCPFSLPIPVCKGTRAIGKNSPTI